MEFLADFLGYLKERKKFWLAPLIVVLLVLGALLVLSQGTVVAPFLYAIF